MSAKLKINYMLRSQSESILNEITDIKSDMIALSR